MLSAPSCQGKQETLRKQSTKLTWKAFCHVVSAWRMRLCSYETGESPVQPHTIFTLKPEWRKRGRRSHVMYVMDQANLPVEWYGKRLYSPGKHIAAIIFYERERHKWTNMGGSRSQLELSGHSFKWIWYAGLEIRTRTHSLKIWRVKIQSGKDVGGGCWILNFWESLPENCELSKTCRRCLWKSHVYLPH